uniref:SAP domain-containing protein n=1 Tax=Globodera pallida TaxID=36090 RepID=A0A183BHY3_GLOPA
MNQEQVKKSLHELKVNELRNELEKRGIEKSGIKAILIDRLVQAARISCCMSVLVKAVSQAVDQQSYQSAVSVGTVDYVLTLGKFSKQKSLHELKVNELRNELEKRGIEKSGIKAILIDRLVQALKAEGHDVQTYQFNMAELQANQLESKVVDSSSDVMILEQNGENAEKIAAVAVVETVSNEEEADKLDECAGATEPGGQNLLSQDAVVEQGQNQTPDADTLAQQPKEKTVQETEKNDEESSCPTIGQNDVVVEQPVPAGPPLAAVPVQNDDAGEEDEPDIIIESPPKHTIKTECIEEVVVVGSSPAAAATTSVGMNPKESVTVTTTALSPIVQQQKKLSNATPTTAAVAAGEPLFSSTPNATISNTTSTTAKLVAHVCSSSTTASTESVVLITDHRAAKEVANVAQIDGKQQQRQSVGSANLVDGNNLSASLWIRNITTTTKAADLKALFSKHGKVITAKIFTTKNKQSPTCFGYVTLADAETADVCAQKLNRSNFKGRIINVEKADRSNLSQIGAGQQQQQQQTAAVTSGTSKDSASGTPRTSGKSGGGSKSTGGDPGASSSSSKKVRPRIVAVPESPGKKAAASSSSIKKRITKHGGGGGGVSGGGSTSNKYDYNSRNRNNRRNFRSRVAPFVQRGNAVSSTQQYIAKTRVEQPPSIYRRLVHQTSRGIRVSASMYDGSSAAAQYGQQRMDLAGFRDFSSHRQHHAAADPTPGECREILDLSSLDGPSIIRDDNSRNRNNRRNFRSRVAPFVQRGNAVSSTQQYIAKTRVEQPPSIYRRLVHQTSRGIRVSASMYDGSSAAAQYGQQRMDLAGFRDFPSHRQHHAAADPRADSRRFAPAGGNDEREEMLRLMRRREEEHRKKEEELRLEREHERLKYEREKLERERLELEHMKLAAQIQASGWIQAAAMPVAAAAGLAAPPAAGMVGATTASARAASASQQQQQHRQQVDSVARHERHHMEARTSSKKDSTKMSASMGRSSVGGRAKESSSRSHHDARRPSPARAQRRSRSRSPLRRSSTRTEKNASQAASKGSSASTWTTKSSTPSALSSRLVKQRDGGNGRRSSSRGAGAGAGGGSVSHHQSSAYGTGDAGGGTLHPFAQPFGSATLSSYEKQNQYTIGDGGSRMTSSAASGGYERHGSSQNSQLQGRSFYNDRYGDTQAATDPYTGRTDLSYAQRIGQYSGTIGGGGREEVFGGGSAAFGDSGLSSYSSSAQHYGSRGHAAGQQQQQASYYNQSSSWNSSGGAERAADVVNSRAFNAASTSGGSGGGTSGWGRQADDILTEWNMYGSSPQKDNNPSSGGRFQQQSLSSSYGGGRTGGGGSMFSGGGGGGGRRY